MQIEIMKVFFLPITFLLAVLFVLRYLPFFVVAGHVEPEKVSCTVLDVSHDFVGWAGIERFSVVVETGGEIYEIRDRDTYYLYRDRVGQSFPAELGYTVYAFGIRMERYVYLSGNYGVDWKVNDLLYKQQTKEVLKKCQKLLQ